MPLDFPQCKTIVVGPKRHLVRRSDRVAIEGIVLQNSFLGCVQSIPGALARSLENHVGGT